MSAEMERFRRLLLLSILVRLSSELSRIADADAQTTTNTERIQVRPPTRSVGKRGKRQRKMAYKPNKKRQRPQNTTPSDAELNAQEAKFKLKELHRAHKAGEYLCMLACATEHCVSPYTTARIHAYREEEERQRRSTQLHTQISEKIDEIECLYEQLCTNLDVNAVTTTQKKPESEKEEGVEEEELD